jgi:hypothetical protein
MQTKHWNEWFIPAHLFLDMKMQKPAVKAWLCSFVSSAAGMQGRSGGELLNHDEVCLQPSSRVEK